MPFIFTRRLNSLLTQVTVRSVHESGAAGTVRIFLCNEVSLLSLNTVMLFIDMTLTTCIHAWMHARVCF